MHSQKCNTNNQSAPHRCSIARSYEMQKPKQAQQCNTTIYVVHPQRSMSTGKLASVNPLPRCIHYSKERFNTPSLQLMVKHAFNIFSHLCKNEHPYTILAHNTEKYSEGIPRTLRVIPYRRGEETQTQAFKQPIPLAI